MLLHCPSRKCNTTRDHKLKVDSYEAICMDCGETNNMVSEFMKHAMKGAGDIYRSTQAKKAFMYKCPKCTIDRGVKIVDEKALCETCLQPLNLSAPMIEAVKQIAGVKSESPKAAVKPAHHKVAAPAPTPASEVEDEELDGEAKAELNKGVIKRRSE